MPFRELSTKLVPELTDARMAAVALGDPLTARSPPIVHSVPQPPRRQPALCVSPCPTGPGLSTRPLLTEGAFICFPLVGHAGMVLGFWSSWPDRPLF